MNCENMTIQNATKPDNKKHCDLEEILHNHDQESLYMEIMLSSDEAMESILRDLEDDR